MKKILIVLGLMICSNLALAQSQRNPCYYPTPTSTNCIPTSSTTPLPTTASISGFHQDSVLAPITATTSGVSSAAFTAGKVIVVTNAGSTNIAYCQLGNSATTSGQPVAPSGGWFAFTSTSETTVTCATSTSTTTVNFSVGTGIPTGTGGGGGSSSGGGAVTLASGAVASGAYSSGSIASGAYASGSIGSGAVASGAVSAGAYAAGALAAGAFATGAGVDGWDLTRGTKADVVCATAVGNCTEMALLKFLNTSVTSPPPLNVNTVSTAWTGLTPGVAQTGTIIAANMDLSSVAGIALGAMANYGTSPGAVKVQGVNAFVTNVPAVSQSGTWTMQPGNTANTTPWLFGLNTTPSLANGNGVVPTQGGTALSATNGGFQNILQGNVALSATNGLYANLLQGNAVLSTTNPSFTRLTDGTTAQVTDPCQGSTKSYLPITLATAAVKVIATGVSAKRIYVCAVDLTNNAADSIAVFEATTGTTCATAAVALVGAGTSVATAATGYNFAANGGISKGTGGYAIWQTSVNNNDLCIAQSATTQLSGYITYVTQ